MKVTLAQRKYVLGDMDANLHTMEESVRAAEGELVVFPEMFLTGYGVRDQVFSLAQDPGNSPIIEKVRQLAGETSRSIVFGLPLKDRFYRGNVYNGALLVEPSGQVHEYHKTFLPNFGPFEERLYFSEGGAPGLFDTALGRIGIIICYDIFFPELVRSLALAGAEVIICISASPTISREFFELLIHARAVENTVFMVYSNVVGADRDLVFWGGAEVVGPLGNTIAKAPYHEEAVLESELSRHDILKSRRSRPGLRDIREEVFHDLLDAVIDRK